MSFGHWRRGRTWRTHAKDEPTGRVIEVQGTSEVGLLVAVDANGAAAAPAAGGWALGVVVAKQTDESGTHLADGTASQTTSYLGVQIDGVVDVVGGGSDRPWRCRHGKGQRQGRHADRCQRHPRSST